MTTLARQPLASFGTSKLQTPSWNFDTIANETAESEDDEIVFVCERKKDVPRYVTAHSSDGMPAPAHIKQDGNSSGLATERKRFLDDLSCNKDDQVRKKVKLEHDAQENIASSRTSRDAGRKEYSSTKFQSSDLRRTIKHHSPTRRTPSLPLPQRSSPRTEQPPEALPSATRNPSAKRVASNTAKVPLEKPHNISALPPKSTFSIAAQKATRVRGFLLEDDSDAENSPTPPSPSKPASKSRHLNADTIQQERAEREAAKLESKRLRTQALDRRVRTPPESVDDNDTESKGTGPVALNLATNGEDTAARAVGSLTTPNSSTTSTQPSTKYPIISRQDPPMQLIGHSCTSRQYASTNSLPKVGLTDDDLRRSDVNDGTLLSKRRDVLSDRATSGLSLSDLQAPAAKKEKHSSKHRYAGGRPEPSQSISSERGIVQAEKQISQTGSKETAYKAQATREAGAADTVDAAWEAAKLAKEKVESRHDLAEKARQEADAKRKAEWERKDIEKRMMEERRHRELEIAKTEQRDTALKKAAECERERDVFSVRESALSKLQAAAKKSADVRRQQEENAKQQQYSKLSGVGAKAVAERPVLAESRNLITKEESESRPYDHFNPPIVKTVASISTLAVDIDANQPTPTSQEVFQLNDTEPKKAERVQKNVNKVGEISHIDTAQPNISLPTTTESVGESESKASNKDGIRVESVAQPISPAPMSLHKFAELSPSTRSGFNRVAHERQLGEITREDVRLLRWRDAGKLFSAISTHLEQTFGYTRNKDTLRTHYKQIKDAFHRANIPDGLIDAVEEGSEEARNKLNVLIHGDQWPLCNSRKGQAISKPATDVEGNHAPKPSSIPDILPLDIKLVQWKDSKRFSWLEIELLHQQQLGQRRSKDILGKRYRRVKELLTTIEVDDKLLAAVAAGDIAAVEQLNATIRGQNLVPAKPWSARDISQDTPGRLAVGNRPISQEQQQSSASWTAKHESSTPHSAKFQPSVSSVEHPEFGGKTITKEELLAMGARFAEADLDEIKSESGSDLSVPGVTSEDYCHYAYQIQHRQITNEEMADGDTIDMIPWSVCDQEYEDLSEANQATTRAIFSAPAGSQSIVTEDDNYDLQCTNDEGKKSWTLENKDKGITQVRVIEYLRTFYDRKLPGCAARLIERKAYVIMRGNLVKNENGSVNNGLFGDSKAEYTLEPSDKNVYTALELANEFAVKAFVKGTFWSKTTHLNTRQAEIQQAERGFLAQLDDGELFHREFNGTKVWVEERRIVGPRNIF